MIFALIANTAFAADYQITLRIEDRRGRLVVDQSRLIREHGPRAVPFLWGRAPAAALVTTNADKVCVWLADQDGEPLLALGAGGCTTFRDRDTLESSIEIETPEGRVLLRVVARPESVPATLDPTGTAPPPGR